MNVARRHCRAHGNVISRHQHVDSFRQDDLRYDLRRLFRPAGQQRGKSTGSDGDGQYDDTRGFHTLTLTKDDRTGRLMHMAAEAAACTGFDQLKVKAWLRSGV